MSHLVDTVAPTCLGAGFRWLLASSWISNLGDGIAIAAGPLLVASQTDDAFLVALAALVQWLPPLLFGLYAGALSDRLDRRLIVMTVDVVRAIVLVVIATSIATGTVSIAVILVVLFLLGTAEVFADNASQTLLPMLVRRQDLAVANSPWAASSHGYSASPRHSGSPSPALRCSLSSSGASWRTSPMATSREVPIRRAGSVRRGGPGLHLPPGSAGSPR